MTKRPNSRVNLDKANLREAFRVQKTSDMAA